MKTGIIIKIRLFTYKSLRHYGGRQITTYAHTCNATFIEIQRDNTALVELLEDCGGHKKGHKIAVEQTDFNIN